MKYTYQQFVDAAMEHEFLMFDKSMVDEFSSQIEFHSIDGGFHCQLIEMGQSFIVVIREWNFNTEGTSAMFWAIPIDAPFEFVDILKTCREFQSNDNRQYIISKMSQKHPNAIKTPEYCNNAFRQYNIRFHDPVLFKGIVTICGIIPNDRLTDNQEVFMHVHLYEDVKTHQLTVEEIHFAFDKKTETRINTVAEFLEIIHQNYELYTIHDGKRNPKLDQLIQEFEMSNINE